MLFHLNHSEKMSQFLALILIGVLISLPHRGYGDESSSTFKANPDGLVEVEPSYVEFSRTNGSYELLPFRERRGNWGSQISFSYSQYTPYNYESEFSAFDYESAYGYSSELPLIEVQYTLKKNFPWGSLGGELGIGIYENSSDLAAVDSQLRLIPIRLGGVLILDGFTRIPYIAPYVAGGAYTMVFEEVLDGHNTFGGNTQVAPYFTIGAQFNLDWLDPIASRQGYEENGIQATFVFVEARKFLASVAEKDRDFENDIEPNVGLRIEF